MPGIRLNLAAATAALAVGCTQAHADPPICSVEILGPSLNGFGMSERGDVVGRRIDSGQVGHAFIVRVGGVLIEDLPTPAPWVSSDAYAVSGNRVVVGAVSTGAIASVGSRAAAWRIVDGEWQFELLGALPGDTFSTALDINDGGDIIGGSGGLGIGMYPRTVLFAPGGPVLLEGIDTPAGINNARQVVAGSRILDLGTMQVQTIPLPPGNWQGVVSVDVSESGGICGYILGFSGCSTFPVRWLPASGWEFVGGCATATAATSINSRGDVLQYVQSGGIGANLVPEGATPIESMIDPSAGPWSATGVSAINDARQMLVTLRQGSSAPVLARLTPRRGPDLSGDGVVDGTDLSVLLAAWGTGSADISGDGIVDAYDLSSLLAAWSG